MKRIIQYTFVLWGLLGNASASPAATTIVVKPDGTGDYPTLEAAVFSAPYGTEDEPVTIILKPGVYEEVVYVQRERRYMRIIGEDPETTIIRYGLHANMMGNDGEKIGTFRTPTLIVDADNFTMENITVENTAGPVGQALALRVDGDRVVFRNCVFYGWQDTIFVNRGRHYFKDCSISGSTDFIFGGATAFFEGCDIRIRRGHYITAAATPPTSEYGLVFVDCDIRAETDDASTYLGRPWRDNAATIFANCRMSDVVKPEGWHNWGKPERERTTRYFEYGNSGPGASMDGRVDWVGSLDATTAGHLRPEIVLAGEDGWDPNKGWFVPLTSSSLWYEQPAQVWTEALPVGNGGFGAMIFGNPSQERLQFNLDTIWGGTIHSYHRPGAWKHLERIRQLLLAGKQDEAEQLAMERFMSIPLRQMKYKPFGDIYIKHPGHDEAVSYKRELDLSTGVATVRYKVGETVFLRETFASHPDNLIVHRIHAEGPDPVNISIKLDSPHEASGVTVIDGESLWLTGVVQLPDGVRFAAAVTVHAEQGSVTQSDNSLVVEGARSVTIKLAGASSYINFRDLSADPVHKVREILGETADLDFMALLQRHLDDYQALYNRVSLELGSSPYAALPTDQRLENPDKAKDHDLAALLFHYGRYLLISSSRPGSQPANLQGIWNHEMEPSWGSKYTLNINAEMNYWPALVTGLAECAEPLYAMIDDLVVSGRETARAHYNLDGWVVHHNTDLWRGTAPINHSNHGIWPTGGAWLSLHLWEHYLYTRDSRFLRERAYPVMRECARFFEGFLIEDPETGWLISGPSNSPENGGLVMGPTMDHQLIRQLFEATVEAAGILGLDNSDTGQLEELMERIAPNQIGRHGQLQEWLRDIDDPNNTHRHVSHLWGVFPGSDITWTEPDMMEAARQSLLFRGDGGTGWALAWKIALWARFLDGDHAHHMIQQQLNLVRERPDGSHSGPGGVYPNLFDAHPPFQIDGNFGATAGIAEMLLQSHGDEIVVLPSLPAAWPDGSVSGLRARGGFEMAFSWQDGKLVDLSISAAKGGTARLRYGDHSETISLAAGETRNWNP
ncbi:MAG: pectinesterase family protein [Puniceicoccaceae bacterium]